ncbi:MAG: hypothetical protein ACREN6_08970 [Gemmatimonadaceae bacterium]
MNDHPNDEKFEEFLRRETGGYNEPPELTGRDELFASIMAARTEDRGPKAVHHRRLAWIGMAATLVLGVAIGKFALGGRDASTPVVPLAANGNHAALPAGAGNADNASYRRAATAQLSRAEALLTAYGTSSENAGVDRHLSTWARDILSNTRLLLDSPAADDPARRRLLQDLELVLVQMVQRSPQAGVADERAQINRSMERTQVLTRLRSVLPAGPNN